MSTSGITRRGSRFFVDTHVSGHRVRKGGFRNEAEAAEWLFQVQESPAALEAYVRGRLAARSAPAQPASVLSVSQAMTAYMDGHGGQIKTADRYRQLQRHVEQHLGRHPAETFRQQHVDAYEKARRKEGAAPKSIKHELNFIRTCLRYAYLNDQLQQPPKFVVRIKTSPRKRIASTAEAGQLMGLGDVSLRRAITIAWSTGMRVGGVREARWSWVNHVNRTITIPAEFAKNGEEHTSPLPPMLWELLQEEPRHPDFLFCRWRRGRNGKGKLQVTPWTKTTFWRAWDALRKSAGAGDLWFHDLRRSMATTAQERGHSAAAVQAVGGWLDPAVMQRCYSHATEAARRAVAEDMEQLLVGSSVGSSQPEQQELTGDSMEVPGIEERTSRVLN